MCVEVTTQTIKRVTDCLLILTLNLAEHLAVILMELIWAHLVLPKRVCQRLNRVLQPTQAV